MHACLRHVRRPTGNRPPSPRARRATNGSSTLTRTANSQNELSTYTYDARGNLTNDGTFKYIFDGWNRLAEVDDESDNFKVFYQYDGLGRRISETTIDGSGNIQVNNLWYDLSGQTLWESNSSNSTTTRYVDSPLGINLPVLRQRDTDANGSLDQTVYFTHDANQDITAVLNTGGSVLQRELYDSYGQIKFYSADWNGTVSDGYALKPSWQGGMRDLITGMIHFGAPGRDYNPRTFTWNSADPLVFVDGANWYLPMGDNPINETDPDGMKAVFFSGFHVGKLGYLWGLAGGFNPIGRTPETPWDGIPGITQYGYQESETAEHDILQYYGFPHSKGQCHLEPLAIIADSIGGSAAIQLVRDLAWDGITIDLLVLLDPVLHEWRSTKLLTYESFGIVGPAVDSYAIPSNNVSRLWIWRQTQDPEAVGADVSNPFGMYPTQVGINPIGTWLNNRTARVAPHVLKHVEIDDDDTIYDKVSQEYEREMYNWGRMKFNLGGQPIV